MKFRVTRNNVADGSRKEFDSCPVALCLKEKGYENVLVSRGSAVGLKKDVLILFSLPSKVRTFIDLFDDGQKVKAFSFEMEGVRL